MNGQTDWDGAERRKSMMELEARLATLSRTLDKMETNQAAISHRLDSIETSIAKVEGAWTFARYVFPIVVAIPAAMWALYDWTRDHVK